MKGLFVGSLMMLMLGLTACGQSGPLYMPDSEQGQKDQAKEEATK